MFSFQVLRVPSRQWLNRTLIAIVARLRGGIWRKDGGVSPRTFLDVSRRTGARSEQQALPRLLDDGRVDGVGLVGIGFGFVRSGFYFIRCRQTPTGRVRSGTDGPVTLGGVSGSMRFLGCLSDLALCTCTACRRLRLLAPSALEGSGGLINEEERAPGVVNDAWMSAFIFWHPTNKLVREEHNMLGHTLMCVHKIV